MPSQLAEEIIETGRATVASIKSTIKIWSRASPQSPPRGYAAAFPEVSNQLPIVENALIGIIDRHEGQVSEVDSSEDNANYQLVQTCSHNATKLEDMFRQMVCGPGDITTRQAHYSQMARSDGTIEVLMKTMLTAIRGIIQDSEQQKLDLALEAIDKLPSSLADPKTGQKVINITNNGPGFMPSHTGENGIQNNSGSTFSGTFQHPLTVNTYPANHQSSGTG